MKTASRRDSELFPNSGGFFQALEPLRGAAYKPPLFCAFRDDEFPDVGKNILPKFFRGRRMKTA